MNNSTVDNIQGAPSSNQPPAVRAIASIISVLFHPVFMPVVMALVVFKLAPAGFAGLAPKQVALLFISIGLTAVFFPLFTVLLMKALGFVKSFTLADQRERVIMLIACMFFYFWISHVMNNMQGAIPQSLKVLFLGNFWGIILIFLASIFTRVSMHTAAAGGMVGIIAVLHLSTDVNVIIPFFVALAIAGIIGTARLLLGAHKRGDVWLGYIIGIVSQLGAYLYISH